MKKISTTCPIEKAQEVIGGKWKVCILGKLLVRTYRYGELKKEIPDVSNKMLTQTLRALERAELVDRHVYAVVPPKTEYSLTALGKTLEPMLVEIEKWSLLNKDKVDKFIEQILSE
jgi:DNA-binding HxlR family transcriptional regulator